MSLKFEDFSELFKGGLPAGNYKDTKIVYTEAAVRNILINFERKLTESLQQDNSPDRANLCPNCKQIVKAGICFRCGVTLD